MYLLNKISEEVNDKKDNIGIFNYMLNADDNCMF